MTTAPYEPPPPVKTEKKPEIARISIRLTKAEAAELHEIADAFNGLDASLGAERKYKWSAAGVMERMIRLGMKEFWAQVGGPPKEGESRADFVRRATAEIKKSQRK